MKLETNIKNKESVEVKLILSWQEFEPIIKEMTRDLGKDLEVPGFRKSQAPLKAIQQKFGSDKIYQEAALLALKKNWQELIQKISQETVGRPKINVLKLAPQNGLEMSVTFIVKPTVKLDDYRKTAKKLNAQRQQDFQVSQEELQSAINWLLRSRAKYTTINSGAKMGDFVEVDFNSFVEGQPLEGGKSIHHPMILGEGHFMKGFEEELLGLKSGEHKNFSLVAPADYYRQDLAGKTLSFEVTVRSVQEVSLPEFNDQFAQNIGKFKDTREFEQSIIEGLKKEKTVKEKREFEVNLIWVIADESRVEIPSSLIEQELDALVIDLKDEIKKAKVNFEDYLKQLGKTLPELRQSLKERAERNLRITFLFQAIAKKENIGVSDQEVNKAINNYLNKFDSIKRTRLEVDLENLRIYTKNTLLNQKVLIFLETTASSQ